MAVLASKLNHKCLLTMALRLVGEFQNHSMRLRRTKAYFVYCSYNGLESSKFRNSLRIIIFTGLYVSLIVNISFIDTTCIHTLLLHDQLEQEHQLIPIELAKNFSCSPNGHRPMPITTLGSPGILLLLVNRTSMTATTDDDGHLKKDEHRPVENVLPDTFLYYYKSIQTPFICGYLGTVFRGLVSGWSSRGSVVQ